MRIVSLQPSAHVDHITEDGVELTQLPYPFHVQPDGSVARQDFWRGSPLAVIGFVSDPHRQEVDLWWDDVYHDPDRMVGMYLITRDADGSMHSHMLAIASVAVSEDGGS